MRAYVFFNLPAVLPHSLVSPSNLTREAWKGVESERKWWDFGGVGGEDLSKGAHLTVIYNYTNI